VDVEPDLDFFIAEKGEARATANVWDSFRESADFFESLRSTLPLGEKPAFSWFVRADPQVAFDLLAEQFNWMFQRVAFTS